MTSLEDLITIYQALDEVEKETKGNELYGLILQRAEQEGLNSLQLTRLMTEITLNKAVEEIYPDGGYHITVVETVDKDGNPAFHAKLERGDN